MCIRYYKNPNKIIWKNGSELNVSVVRTYLAKGEDGDVCKRNLDQIILVKKC